MPTNESIAAFAKLEISSSALPALYVTAVILFLLPLLCVVWWLRKNKGAVSARYILAGALGFIVSARVLELGVHYVCILGDNPVARFINGSTVAYVIYGIVMAGVFEEVGRYVVLRYIMKRRKTRENALLYGLAHGGIEVWLVVLPSVISMIAVCILFSRAETLTAMQQLNITEDVAAVAYPQVVSATAFNWGQAVFMIAERVFAMTIHTSLSIVVFYAVCNNSPKQLWLAIALHMAMDLFAALYQRGVVSLPATELWCFLWAVISALLARRYYRRLSPNGEETLSPAE